MEKEKVIIEAAGGLIWRDSTNNKELAVIHRTKHNDWTLPKGKLKPGETWKEAALREVYEETGCKVEIENFAGCICYIPANIPKVVLYWNMKQIGECNFQPNNEVDQLQWLEWSRAISLLNYHDERELVKKNI